MRERVAAVESVVVVMPFVSMLDVDSSKDTVSVGCRVRIDGLRAKPEFNGTHATVKSYNEEKGRFDVQPDDSADYLSNSKYGKSTVG